MKNRTVLLIFIFVFTHQLYAQNDYKFTADDIYCDSLINSNLYQTFFIDSLALGLFPLPIINYDQLNHRINNSNYSNVTIVTKSQLKIVSNNIALNGRVLSYENSTILIDDLSELSFTYNNDFLDILSGFASGFLSGSFVVMCYEGFDSLFGSDGIEWEQVLIVGGATSIIGAIIASLSEEKIIRFVP